MNSTLSDPKGLTRRQFSRAAAGGCLSLLSASACRAQPRQTFPAERFDIRPGATPHQNDIGVRAALDALRRDGGGELVFGPGRYGFAMRSPWEISSRIQISGAGKQRTVLERTDRDPCNWIDATNTSGDHAFKGFTAIGNGQATVNGNGGFLFARTDNRATRSMEKLWFSDIELRNFRSDGWIWFIVLESTRHSIGDITVDGSCSFRSLPGNSRGPRDRGIWSSAMIFQGSLLPDRRGGRIRGVRIGAVEADIPHIKSLCVIWAAVEDTHIDRPRIERCGTIEIGSDSGAYALMIGNETIGASNPDGIQIIGPVIKACQSAGVYFVSWGGSGGTCQFDGAGGYIANVTDTANGTLPKGAIAATDGATNLIIKNVRAINCVAAVDVLLAPGGRLSVSGVDAEGIPRNQNAIRIGMQEGLANTGPAAGVEVSDIHVRASAKDVTGIRLLTRHPIGAVRLSGRIDLDVPYIGISAYQEHGSTEVDPFSSFNWEGDAVIRNAVAGAIVFRNNVSPLNITANIVILRGEILGARDHRVKADGALNMNLEGSVQIDGVRQGDNPAWDARMRGRPNQHAYVRPGSVRFTNSTPGLRATAGSVDGESED